MLMLLLLLLLVWWFGLELNHPEQPGGLATPRPRVEAVLALVSCCHARAVCPGCQLAPSVDHAIFNYIN